MNDFVIHPLTVKSSTISMQKIIIMLVVLILVGMGSGFGLAKLMPSAKVSTTATGGSNATDNSQTQAVVGVQDKSTFKDNATGIVTKGGITGESDYHLVRPGGDSQNVYLTSTTVDLSKYLDKKVKVWGQTINSNQAGWFMDVGLVEVQ